MKTAIIGAGICGLYVARNLAEKGNEVVVFEKKDKVGKEVCSGLFSDRIIKFVPEAEALIQNRINYALIHFPKKTLKINFSKDFLVMEHEKLDELASISAIRAGAKILLNRKIKSIPGGFDRIIGCDGVLSVTRNILLMKNPAFRLGIQSFQDTEDYSNFVETWPTPEGFLWKIPRGKNVEYGIMENPKRAYKIFKKFLSDNNVQENRIKAWPIPLGGKDFFIPKNPRITLCGDSAALTKPWSGGGVIWGLTAADILLKNFPNFLKYRVEAKKAFYIKIIFSKIAVKMVYFLGFKVPWILPANFKIDGDSLSFKS